MKISAILLAILSVLISACVRNSSQQTPDFTKPVSTLQPYQPSTPSNVISESDSAYKLMVEAVEKDFTKKIKQVDAGIFYSKLKTILKEHQTTVYGLYKELVFVYKNAEEWAEIKGTEFRAGTGKMRRLHNYYDILKEKTKIGEEEFMTKYNVDSRFISVFQSNYCSCYDGINSVPYCKEGKCALIDGEYWK